jgi:hypothetical protein
VARWCHRRSRRDRRLHCRTRSGGGVQDGRGFPSRRVSPGRSPPHRAEGKGSDDPGTRRATAAVRHRLPDQARSGRSAPGDSRSPRLARRLVGRRLGKRPGPGARSWSPPRDGRIKGMVRDDTITAQEYSYLMRFQPEPEGGYTVTCPTLLLRRDPGGGPRDGRRGDRGLPREPAARRCANPRERRHATAHLRRADRPLRSYSAGCAFDRVFSRSTTEAPS